MQNFKLPGPGEIGYGMNKWLVVFMLWMICVLNYADRQAVFSIFTILEKTYGFNKKELGLIGSAFMIVYASLSPLAGIVGDKFKRKWIIIVGLYTWSLFTGLTCLCSKLWQFIFVRGAEGLGETFYFPASTTLMSDYHAKTTRSRALGFHHTGTYLGTIVGGVLTGLLAQKYSWHTPFIVLGSSGVLLGIVLMLFIREPERGENEIAEIAHREVDAAEIAEANIDGAKIAEPEIGHGHIDKALSSATQLDRAQPDRAQPHLAQLHRPQPDRAQPHLAQPHLAQLHRPQPDRAQPHLAQLDRPPLDRAQLDRAQLDRDQLDRAQLDRAHLARTQLDRGHLHGYSPNVPLKLFIPELLRNKSAMTLLAVFFLANFVTLPFYAWLPIFISEKFHKDIAQAAFTGTFYLQSSSAAGAILGGSIADRWRKRCRGGRIFTQAIGVILYAPFMYMLGGTQGYLTCIVAMCVLGLFKGMYDANVWAAFYDVVPLSRRATTCGLANTLAWVGGSISVFLVGVVVDAKWFTMSQTLQGFPFLNLLMAFLLLRAGWSQRAYAEGDK